MSKSFDTQSVGLPQLYAQLRAKDVANSASAAGALIRGNGVNAIVVDAGAQVVKVRAVIYNYGAFSPQLPVRISVATAEVAATLDDVTATSGTIVGVSAAALTSVVGGVVSVLPASSDGKIDIDLTLAAGTGAQDLKVLIEAGNEQVSVALPVA